MRNPEKLKHFSDKNVQASQECCASRDPSSLRRARENHMKIDHGPAMPSHMIPQVHMLL